MPKPFTMSVFRRKGREFFECQWIDPTTGKKKTRSTKETTKKLADRWAGQLAKKLEEGTYQEKNRTTWEQVCDRYESEVLPTLSPRTAAKTAVVINAIDRIINPHLASSLNSSEISRFQAALRENGSSEATIKGYLAYLRSILSWAKEQKLIAEVPSITMPKRTGTMRGRPVTAEEFERMLSKVRGVVTPEIKLNPTEAETLAHADLCDRITASWEHLLRGLWFSGLRLGEALTLHWTDDRLLCVDLSGRRAKLRFQPEGQKANRYEESPVAPDFESFLNETPPQDRHGFVFNPLKQNGRRSTGLHQVSVAITHIGRAANVKVSEKPTRKRGKDGQPLPPKVKYASAHDLRRAFGFRWSSLIMPATLQQFMRHESVQTTLDYYSGRNAEAAADAAHAALAAKNRGSTEILANSGLSVDRPQTPVSTQPVHSEQV
ncbi:MAG: hypothetical protein IT428_33010 [Planctomycetaceae bacterium]|nr:hypothetical protein [Planctomycetaceae bacterium]